MFWCFGKLLCQPALRRGQLQNYPLQGLHFALFCASRRRFAFGILVGIQRKRYLILFTRRDSHQPKRQQNILRFGYGHGAILKQIVGANRVGAIYICRHRQHRAALLGSEPRGDK